MIVQDDNEFMNTQESNKKTINKPNLSNQVNMRIRQKNNYYIKKGDLDNDQKVVVRNKDQKKNRNRALERLRDLERIQKYN